MQDSTEHLLIFARLPKAGVNKTRLIPAIGAENATRVYRQLVDQTLRQARRLASERDCRVAVCFTGGTAGELQAALGNDLEYREQVGESLGDRLQFASQTAFEAGAERVVIIGTDCHSLTSDDVATAFEHLRKRDMVIGPALDGGYYLIGLAANYPSLFSGIDWSTSRVFEQTRQKSRMLNLSVHVLRELPDVDHPEDLLPLRSTADSARFPLQTQAGRLSVIIPTLNEQANLTATLASVGPVAGNLEIIVVDAGSKDQTLSIAQQHGCRTFVGNPGRGLQMNAGAAMATGEHLLFLHADTRLPEGYHQEIQRVLASAVACGAFPLEIDAPGLVFRWIESGVRLRSRMLQMPYGDQALFFRSADFYAHGGFKPMAIMEDYELIDRIRRVGKIGLATNSVKTSARRWHQRGVVRTTLINQLCVVAYRLGYSDQSIARLYRGR